MRNDIFTKPCVSMRVRKGGQMIEITLEDFKKQFLEEVMGVEEWEQGDLKGWVQDMAEKVYYAGYRKEDK